MKPWMISTSIFVALIAGAMLSTGAAYTPLQSSRVQVLNSAVTQIPRLIASHGLVINNRGPNSIFCGWGTNAGDGGQPYYPDAGPTVAVNGGIEIASGAMFSASLSGRIAVWCIAASADQVAPADTEIGEAP